MTRVLTPCLLLILLSTSGVFAQNPDSWEEFCPIISVDCPANTLNSNEPIAFSASILGGKQSLPLKFKWKISDGTIVSGQGTWKLVVDAKKIRGQEITATIEIEGISEYCTKTASCTVRKFTSEPILPHKAGEYGHLGLIEERNLLDEFAKRLRENPTFRGYIYVYAGRNAGVGEAQLLARRAKKYLVERHSIHKNRISWKDGGYREQLTVELWLLPKGAPEPFIIPTISPDNTKEMKLNK